ncbi:putative glycosyl hydrolase 18 family protein [Lyophyllum shimeji]|uniref:Glycosyl hydrolase 18 family protein n=1 Tax=Lyophyllum shimeji TaxID=47721 RepID=A0A9P3PI89_LYOSH|nr:putative glycosyl hydrolase 18 family protein [Lyophyllum shimeji]
MVRFYNNQCGLQAFGQANNWNYGLWDYWARFTSPNKNVKVYVGAPASSTAAGTGYVSIDTLKTIASQTRNSFPSFGGIMLWDASQAYANNRYDLAIKNALVAAGGTGFTFPSCSAPAWSAGTGYSGGSKVSFNGYIWQAKWYASSQPASNPNSEWSAISACSGGGSTTTPTPTPGGNCAGVAAWSSSTAYTGGAQVVYSSHLWTAQWWTQGETPGVSSVWVDKGACTSMQAAKTSHPSEASSKSTVSKTKNSRFFKF